MATKAYCKFCKDVKELVIVYDNAFCIECRRLIGHTVNTKE